MTAQYMEEDADARQERLDAWVDELKKEAVRQMEGARTSSLHAEHAEHACNGLHTSVADVLPFPAQRLLTQPSLVSALQA